MAIKTFGALRFDEGDNRWVIDQAQPHVCIKLKSIFSRIPKSSSTPFYFDNSPENCSDLLWFMDRYPMKIWEEDVQRLKSGKECHLMTASQLESILMPEYTPAVATLKNGYTARNYQLVGADFHAARKRFLLGDDLGLGKTLTGILCQMNPASLPGIVVVQTHLPVQWQVEGIEKFTNLKTHIISKTKVYNLPKADLYIIKYSILSSWTDIFATGFFKGAIFDEIQELRISGSQKYGGARVLSENVEYCLGMSATPIYNYGNEIYNVLNLINPGCLGGYDDFLREWAVPIGQNKYKVKDPAALGAYLRDNYLVLRRTRKEVGRELPPINKIVVPVEYDEKEADKAEDLARTLAIKTVSGSFMERGQAARELDALARHVTGVSKARSVAAFVRILLDGGDPVVLSGWHRDVYDIWMAELDDFNPVLYTGTESPKQKEESKRAFIAGETNLFIISNRSGIGLDGLQHHCNTVVVGELDWSPKVHDQLIGRVDRDGQENQVTAYFPVCEFGSDPVIIDILGLKSSQAHGIMNPLDMVADQYSDESRMKKLAESFLNKKVIHT